MVVQQQSESMAVNKNKNFDLAVALEYNEQDGAVVGGYNSSSTERAQCLLAPRILIKGGPAEAAWLVRMAHQLGVPVVEDDGAALALSELPLDEEIPEDLYQAVAIVLNKIELGSR